MLNYNSNSFQHYTESEFVKVSTTIPKELRDAIKQQGLKLSKVLLQGLYLLLDENLLCLRSINMPDKPQNFAGSMQEVHQGLSK